jgi:hypothetical protein
MEESKQFSAEVSRHFYARRWQIDRPAQLDCHSLTTVLQLDDSECSKFSLFFAFPTGNGLLIFAFRPTLRMPHSTPISGDLMQNYAFYDLTNLTLN